MSASVTGTSEWTEASEEVCHNEDGRIQLRKESLLQEVIHSEKLNRAFRRAEAELP